MKISNAKILLIVFIFLLAACGQSQKPEEKKEPDITVTEETPEPTPEPTPQPTPEPTPEPMVIDYDIIKPNEIGQIMIIMYHQVLPESNNVYQRTIEDFKGDLQNLYDMGFRTVSMSDLINNNIDIEAGMTPVVLTFDDGHSSAFSLVETDTGTSPTEDCAVDIMNKFANRYPEFGRNAIFYINAQTEPFKGAGTLDERFRYLLDNGYEIGSHTYSHAHLGSLSAEGIQEEIGSVHKIVLEKAGYEITSISYPYGERPIESLREYAMRGEYDGIKYNYSSAVRVGLTGGSAAPNNVGFEASNLPRVQGSDHENTDLGWFLRNYSNGPGSRYISDGMPERISIPASAKDNVNMDSIGDKELYLY